MIFFLSPLQRGAAQILNGGFAPVPWKTDDAVALYCSPTCPPARRAMLWWHSKVSLLEDGDSGSGWAALEGKMSPLCEGDIDGEGFFNPGKNQVIT